MFRSWFLGLKDLIKGLEVNLVAFIFVFLVFLRNHLLLLKHSVDRGFVKLKACDHISFKVLGDCCWGGCGCGYEGTTANGEIPKVVIVHFYLRVGQKLVSSILGVWNI